MIRRGLLALALVLAPLFATGDELQDRLVAAVRAYADLTPDYPDVALGIATALVEDASATANPAEIVNVTQVGAWLVRNQPADPGHEDLRGMRARHLAAALTKVMRKNRMFATPVPAQALRVAELRLRLLAAVDTVSPGPSFVERQRYEAEMAARMEQIGIEDAAERARKEAAGAMSRAGGGSPD